MLIDVPEVVDPMSSKLLTDVPEVVDGWIAPNDLTYQYVFINLFIFIEHCLTIKANHCKQLL
jgi:hypothetical protein